MSMPISVVGSCHHDCPDTCGWVVTVEDGVATKMRGNPAHPYSQGELCPKVNRFLGRVKATDRVLHPLIRTGAKGSGEFRQATWDEALGLIANRFNEIIETHGGEAILPWSSAGTQGMIQMSCLDRRLFAALGASRQTGSICGQTASHGTVTTYGSGRTADPMDVRHAEVIIIWGTNTKLTNRHLWPFIDEARTKGAQVVVIDPMRTITAEVADWFIQPLPGTDVALMLATMHVLIRDALIDKDYIAEHSIGFEDLAASVEEWTPERAAVECGLDAADIERFAALYGSTKKTFVRTMIGAEHHENGAMFFRTLACLPVLTGAWTVQGGGMSRSVGAYNGVHVNDSVYDPTVAPTTRHLHMNHLGQNLTDPSLGVHGLFIWGGNPVVSIPNAGEIRRGLARDDLFTVVSEQFLTDTAMYADVVLPAAMQIEQFDVVPSWGSLYLGWNEKAVEPAGEAVPNTEMWRRLAGALGISDPLFELDDLALITMALIDVDLAQLRSDGFIRTNLPVDFLPYANGGFATQSGKALLRNDPMATFGLPALPTYTPPPLRAATPEYPLNLQTPKTHTRFLNSTYSAHHGRLEDGPYVDISAADAAARSVAAGDLVHVSNGQGSLTLAARISERVRPGVVAIPWGWWGPQANVNVLTSEADTDWGGGAAYSDTMVEITRAAV
jgi:anaerobic selenocysteine-containing dehydrogenase